MFMASIGSLVEQLKPIGAAAGIAVATWGVYVSAGLPVPATVAMVKHEVAALNEGMKSLTLIVLEAQLEQHNDARRTLRVERFNLERIVSSADALGKLVLENRRAQIEDQLRNLDDADKKLRDQISKLKQNEKAS